MPECNPNLTITIESPVSGATITSISQIDATITVTGHITITQSACLDNIIVQVQIDSGAFQNVPLTGSAWSYTTTVYQNRQYTITARTTADIPQDADTIADSQSITVTVNGIDDIAPTLTITDPLG